MTDKAFILGFANLTESSPYSIAVRESLEQAIAHDPDIHLIVRDNDLNDKLALENAQAFRDAGADMVVFFHINERIGMQIRSILQLSTLLSIDIPIPLASHFGLNNAQSGEIVGEALVHWVQEHWGGHIDKVLALIDSRVLETIRMRTTNTISTLQQYLSLKDTDVFYLDCGNTRDKTYQNSVPVLQSWAQYEHIAMVGFNADSTFGLLDAAAHIGISDKVVVVGHAADDDILAEVQKPDSPVIAVSHYDPAKYGAEIYKLVEMVRRGERLPNVTYADMDLFTH